MWLFVFQTEEYRITTHKAHIMLRHSALPEWPAIREWSESVWVKGCTGKAFIERFYYFEEGAIKPRIK